MVSTHLKNISQIGSFPQVGMNQTNFWNDQVVYYNSHITGYHFINYIEQANKQFFLKQVSLIHEHRKFPAVFPLLQVNIFHKVFSKTSWTP